MSHGEGAAPAASPGWVPGPLERDGAGGQDWSALPQPSFSQQSPAQPAPCGGWRGAASHGCTPGSRAGRSSRSGRAQLPMASSFQPQPQGQPVPRRGSRAFSLSHGKAHRTRRPGELCAVSFLTGSVGKTRGSRGCAPRPRSPASRPRAGRSLSLQRGMCTAQHQAGGGCLPTASTFAGTSDREMSPCQPGPAQHYTYCFLEAELPGRLPSFSSGAEASAGRGVKGSDRGLLPLPSARFSSLR